jgi:putative nucleotidyltransferase with HDIG domain
MSAENPQASGLSHLQRISINKVKLGMFVSDETPGLEEAGLNARGLISRQETLDKLIQAGVSELYIDPNLGKSSPFALPIPANTSSLKSTTALEQERGKAASIYSDARELVGSLMRNVKLGQAIELAPVEELADEINGSILRNSNALMCMAQIREKDEYLLEHSINVALLMSVFTRYLGYSIEDRHQLVTGALLHDIGKIRVPTQILNKPGKLTDDEWQEMRNHVRHGEEVLLKSEGITPIALAICAQHHEKLNGSGYPRGLKEAKITVAGRLASIVDIYDAITADRVYHQGKSPFDTMKILLELASIDHLDKDLTYKFISCMSLYPVGSLVQLSNGRLAVVIEVNYDKPKLPTVRCFYNTRSENHEQPKVVVLSSPQSDIKVEKVLDPKALGFDLRDFL